MYYKISQVIIILQVLDTSDFTLPMYDGDSYTYPGAAIAIGWALAFSSVLLIPLLALKEFATRSGSAGQRLLLVTAPEEEAERIKAGESPIRTTWEHWASL